jgi:hypothetical protein
MPSNIAPLLYGYASLRRALSAASHVGTIVDGSLLCLLPGRGGEAFWEMLAS